MENRQCQEGRHYSGQGRSGQATRYRSDVIGTNMASRSAEQSEMGAASVSNFTSAPWPNTAASDSRGARVQSYEPSPTLYMHSPSSVAGSVVSTYMHDDDPTVDPRDLMLNSHHAQHQAHYPSMVGDGSSHASRVIPVTFPRRSSDSSLAGALGGLPSPSSPTSVVTPTTAGTSHSDSWIVHGTQSLLSNAGLPFRSGNEGIQGIPHGPVHLYPPMSYQGTTPNAPTFGGESIQGGFYDHAERMGTMHPGELQGASHDVYRSWRPDLVDAKSGQLDNTIRLTDQAVHQGPPIFQVPSTSSPRARLSSTRENDASSLRNPRGHKRARGSKPQPLRGTHVSTGLGPENNMVHYGTVFTQNPGPSPPSSDTASGSMNVRFKSEYPGRSTGGRPTATDKGKGRLILHEENFLYPPAPESSNQAESSSSGKKGRPEQNSKKASALLRSVGPNRPQSIQCPFAECNQTISNQLGFIHRHVQSECQVPSVRAVREIQQAGSKDLQRSKSNRPKIKCPTCRGRVYVRLDRWADHLCGIHGEWHKYKCEEDGCGAEFTSEKDLNSHMKSEH